MINNTNKHVGHYDLLDASNLLRNWNYAKCE